jgi:hypothetical protein
MTRWQEFTKCPGCGLDFATGEGERSCAWGDSPISRKSSTCSATIAGSIC